MRRRDLLAGAGALVGLTGFAASSGIAAAGTVGTAGRARAMTDGDWFIVRNLDVPWARRQLSYLTEAIGPRVSGTGAEVRAAQYIGQVMSTLGYRVALQSFPVSDKRLAEFGFPGDDRWQAPASRQGLIGADVRGQVIDGKAGGEADYPPDVTGKIVLLDHGSVADGDPDNEIRIGRAVRRGAIAVLLVKYAKPGEAKTGTFNPWLPRITVAVPVIGLAQYHGEQIRQRLAGEHSTLELTTTLHSGLTSYNVIAERPAMAPNPNGKVVMVSAHYDTVPGSPGANDDGSGAVLCMELARVLRNLPTRSALRFAWWGSEENGLLGSWHYVDGLDDAEASRIQGCFQNDMCATSWDPAVAYYLLSVDGQHNTVTQSVATAASRLGYANEVVGPVARGSSDHVPFHERGIAAANHSWRGTGGPADLEPIYHTPEDTIELNISLTRWRKAMELIGTATYNVATLP